MGPIPTQQIVASEELDGFCHEEEGLDDEGIEFGMPLVPHPQVLGVDIAGEWELPYRAHSFISYAMATDAQKIEAFPKRQPRDEPLGPTRFTGKECFELWVAGKVIGLCSAHLIGVKTANDIYYYLTLNGIYIKRRWRAKGYLPVLLLEVSRSAFQGLATNLLQGRREGISDFRLQVYAELHSYGGQNAVRCLGYEVDAMLTEFSAAAGITVNYELIDDAW